MAQEAPSNEQPKGYPVRIFVYDLSQGMASSFSQQLIGKQVDGIWHTSIIVYEKEYFYGGGIQSDTPGQTPYGTPLRRIEMGHTYKTQSEFHAYLNKAAPRFSPDKYDLFKHNCNTFADEAMQFLNAQPIPEYITGLPEEFLNSQVGQMLKPMIDNMQQTAMASYGDFGGMGIASKPNLPPINAKYETKIHIKQKEEKQAPPPQARVHADDLRAVLNKYYCKHRHKSMKLHVFDNELSVKITNDDKNAQLYVSMIKRNTEMVNIVQEQGLNEIIKFLGAGGDKPKLSNDTFEIFDELLLMTEAKYLFPIVSLLRLLLMNAMVCSRYSSDFMIVHQILYKIGIPFECLKEEKEEKKESVVDEEMDNMNLMDIHLLQFTTICAVSHLYPGHGDSVNVEDNFINLGINALYVNNCNVRLAAARLLFNIVYEIKRQIILNENANVGNDGLSNKLKQIIDAVFKYFNLQKNSKTEIHIPTFYRLLSILGLVVYCNTDHGKALDINAHKIKEIINNIGYDDDNDINNLQHDIISLLS